MNRSDGFLAGSDSAVERSDALLDSTYLSSLDVEAFINAPSLTYSGDRIVDDLDFSAPKPQNRFDFSDILNISEPTIILLFESFAGRVTKNSRLSTIYFQLGVCA